VAYPGCVNGDCNKPYDCNCKAGWTGHLCDQPEVEIYGEGVRGGRCQPVGSFVCMNGGEDTCHYYGNGTMEGQPECRCRPGYTGTWCENQIASTGTSEIIEPRHSHTDTNQEEDGKISKEAEIDSIVETKPEEEGEKTDGNEEKTEEEISDGVQKQTEVVMDTDNDKVVSDNSETVAEVQNKENPKDANENPKDPEVDPADVDWSKKSESAENSQTDKKPETSSEDKTQPEKSDKTKGVEKSEEIEKSEENVSELGVRAIHSDVFNSGKLIENFGSQEGLQSFHHF